MVNKGGVYPQMTEHILEVLSRHALRNKLIQHDFFIEIDNTVFSKEQVSVMVGQWFFPLHYFPVFLSRQIAVSPVLEMQTFVSRILWEELGEGNPQNAHEKLYVKTIQDAGFDAAKILNAKAFESTKDLVDGYKNSTKNYLSGLGFLYGTEVADLAMVSAIGKAVQKATGKKELPWVDIHVKQEPGHVESASHALQTEFDSNEQKQIIQNAKRMWQLWIAFFDAIQRKIG